ncbi:MAG: hypothetical protein QNJ41_01530 [Xenococcaceae cyanobacterium MO_188.B32]|nr:hypothetical protein [Xenococcaceae cyanobacterium MO_188.B32]
MKDMIWHPEEGDKKVNEYLERTNHAPYGVIATVAVVAFCVFTLAILLGTF